jgi:hypothetical protein
MNSPAIDRIHDRGFELDAHVKPGVMTAYVYQLL